MKKSKYAIGIATALFSVAVAGHAVRAAGEGGAGEKKHEERFCAALTQVDADLTKLKAIGPNSTVDEVRSAASQAKTNIAKVKKEAEKLDTPASKQLTTSLDQLSRETRSIPGSMTLAQAKQRIKDDVKNVGRDAKAVAQESGCPDALQAFEKAPEAGKEPEMGKESEMPQEQETQPKYQHQQQPQDSEQPPGH
ncbi:MAG: hypothetical protein KF773_02195 [Deltaproteobacteria bacterium]|nr:hypothetical protein [Deltaproteobacteria bacterium]MCW5806364.1 hypothetical protein [Deltaproteobacteria bacterium]